MHTNIIIHTHHFQKKNLRDRVIKLKLAHANQNGKVIPKTPKIIVMMMLVRTENDVRIVTWYSYGKFDSCNDSCALLN